MMQSLRTTALSWLGVLALAGGAAAQAGAKAAPPALDPSALKPSTVTYQFSMGGNPGGTSTTTLAKEGDVWVMKQSMESDMFNVQGESQVRASDLAPVSWKQTMQGQMSMTTALQVADGKLTGTANMPDEMGGSRTFNIDAPAGTLLPNQDGLALAVMPLQVGQTFTLNVFGVRSGAIQPVTYNVVAAESVTVPAGTFDAFKVEIPDGDQAGTYWLRKELPHTMLKQEMAAFPVVVEAKTIQ